MFSDHEDGDYFSARNEYEAYYMHFGTGYWRDEDPEACPCRGGGWALSQVDTWHQCPSHFNGQRHPEDDHDEEPEVEVVVPLCPGTELRGDPEKGMRMVSAPTEADDNEPRTHWWEEPLTNDDDIPF